MSSYNNNASHLYCAQKCKTNSKMFNKIIRKTHDQHLEACYRGIAEANPKLPSSHRYIATNTSMVLICALVTYIRMTGDAGLPDAV